VRVGLVVILEHLLALEDQRVRVLGVEISAEDEVISLFLVELAALLHHEATTVSLGVHTVSNGRAEAAAGLAGELSGEIESVAGGVGQGLEDVLELLRVPFLLLLLDPLVALDLVTINSVEQLLGVQRGGKGSVELRVGLGS